MNTTLYRKYRPNTFDNVFGQKYIKKSIINSLNENKLAHAYLFCGPRGVGKTTIARIIAKGVNCLKNGISSKPCLECESCISISKGNNLDVIEIDAASNRGIDEIRSLKEAINYQPVRCRKKVYIIDEIHMLTNEAFNALLKTLEEPPEHVIFILATTELNKLPETIISRCVCFNFKPLVEEEALEMLKNCTTKEKIDISDDSLKLIIKKSGGSARDAFSILEQVITTNLNEKINLELVEKTLGIVASDYYVKFNDLLKKQNKEEIIYFIDKLYVESIQIDVFLRDFCDYLKVNEKDIEYASKIIGTIYQALNEFKYEDDLRIISYIIIFNILKLQKNSVKEKVIINSNDTMQEFSYEKLLNKLKNDGFNIYYSLLSEFQFVEIRNATIYLKQITNKNSTKLLIENDEIKREIEEEIYELLNVRYIIEIIYKNNKSDKLDNFEKKVRSLFEVPKI